MSYFQPAEFHCRCKRDECDAPDTITTDLLSRLDNLRYRLDRPVVITSGLRCPYWNKKEGGTETSEHLTGEAVDIYAPTSIERWDILAANFQGTTPLFKRLGIGPNFVHLGVSKKLPQGVTWAYYSRGIR